MSKTDELYIYTFKVKPKFLSLKQIIKSLKAIKNEHKNIFNSKCFTKLIHKKSKSKINIRFALKYIFHVIKKVFTVYF